MPFSEMCPSEKEGMRDPHEYNLPLFCPQVAERGISPALLCHHALHGASLQSAEYSISVLRACQVLAIKGHSRQLFS